MDSLAPIILFVYNRPWHTEQTLNALSQNELADESVLYIYSDGQKENAKQEDLEKIQRVREMIRTKKWCKEVHIIESEENKGLADSIIDGVTEIVNKHGKIIVLEDDIVTSRGFLKYMNDALNLYENEERVMHISGYMFPVKARLPETFFYNATSSWGWATWKMSWNYLDTNTKYLYNTLKERNLFEKFDYKNRYGFLRQLSDNIDNKLSTWAIKWHTSVFLKNGLSLHPHQSLVNNIGHDSSGNNCGVSDRFSWPLLCNNIKVKLIILRENERARKAMILFNSPDKQPVAKHIKSKLTGIIPDRIKKSIKSILECI